MNLESGYLSAMRAEYRRLTGTLPGEDSDIGIRMALLANQLELLEEELTALKRSADPETAEGIRRSLLAAGLEAALQEEFSRRLLRVTDARIIGGYQTLDEVKQQVRRMLPAHLEVEFDIGILTWEMFEGFGLDFAAWDRRDFTWEWFDLNGDKLGGE